MKQNFNLLNNEDFDRLVCKNFPNLYKDRHKDMFQTGLCWGLCVGKGWNNLIYLLSEALEKEICSYISTLSLEEIDEQEQLGFIPRASTVKEKFACYDEKTEVLTSSGWKYFKDITYEDKVACLINKEYLEYHPPKEIMSYDYSGKMYKLKTRGVDLLVTPNHNLYIAKGSYYDGRYSPPKKVDREFEFTTYEKYFKKNKRFKKSAIWIGESPEYFYLPKYENYWENDFGITNKILPEKQIKIEDWLNFLGWYIAEGCSNADRGEISIACNNTNGGTEKNTIEKCIKNLGYNIKTCMDERSALVFKIYSKQLALWLNNNCGNVSYVKKVPQFIKYLSANLITIFLNSLYEGDGYKAKTAETLTTVSEQLADDVQELILKCGFTSYKTKNPPQTSTHKDKIIKGTCDIFRINWLKDSNYHNTMNKGLSKSSFEDLVDYNGKVYCVAVPEHVIYVRRNGKPYWCGNSLRFYMTTETDEMSWFIDEAERKSYSICEECGEKGKTRPTGWISVMCYGCYSDWIVDKSTKIDDRTKKEEFIKFHTTNIDDEKGTKTLIKKQLKYVNDFFNELKYYKYLWHWKNKFKYLIPNTKRNIKWCIWRIKNRKWIRELRSL